MDHEEKKAARRAKYKEQMQDPEFRAAFLENRKERDRVYAASEGAKNLRRKRYAEKDKKEVLEARREKYAQNRERIRQVQAAYYERNREKIRHQSWVLDLATKYGLTEEDYNDMLISQGGVCAFCGEPPKGGDGRDRILHVDHDHKTGKVRWLLCRGCNHLLGNAKESPEVLLKAAKMLGEWLSSQATI